VGHHPVASTSRRMHPPLPLDPGRDQRARIEA
jgi:hypothetical protein